MSDQQNYVLQSLVVVISWSSSSLVHGLIPSFLLFKNRHREREFQECFRPHSNMLYMKEGRQQYMQEASNNNKLSPHGCKSKWPIMSISNSHDSWVELTLIGNNWYPIVDYKKIFNRGFVFSLRPMSVIVQKIELNCWPSSISPYLLFCNGWIPTFESPIPLQICGWLKCTFTVWYHKGLRFKSNSEHVKVSCCVLCQ